MITRLGIRRTAHGAILIFIAACALWLALSAAGFMPLWLFLIMIAIVMPTIVANFSPTSALAMEPLGEVAGTASAIFGSAQVVGGALLGTIVAQAFDGTVVPVVGGMLLFGLCTLACFLVAERGRLFGSGGSGPTTGSSSAFLRATHSKLQSAGASASCARSSGRETEKRVVGRLLHRLLHGYGLGPELDSLASMAARSGSGAAASRMSSARMARTLRQPLVDLRLERLQRRRDLIDGFCGRRSSKRRSSKRANRSPEKPPRCGFS